ncbi:phasin family protein [Sphingobium cupriresistens]|uniref:Phasin n=2 Tax=Sphingobium cupriresistens TaxID=1132417 RepID=A0A0J8ARE0_9SPHN|nr:phasin family protein [Sphingobium cupriresistens]KMS56960.1 phasin [Sphingobium cupriresistens LL01]RYM14198.1 phasin family protein [Sphingobium cupriresistens]
MAVTPKTPKSSPLAKPGSSTLSASEALKAAEAAIGGAAEKKPAPKKAVSAAVKPIDTNPQKEPTPTPAPTPTPTPAPTPSSTAEIPTEQVDPVAIAAASTAVDAAPEPEITESLAKAETIATQPLPAEGTKIMNDVIETGKKFAEDTKAKFETAYADMNEKAKASVEKSTKAIEELSDIAKGNVEALVESGKIAAKAMETMGQEAVDYSRKNFEKATASFKTFSTVKTPTEFFQLQSQMFSSSFDEFTKEAAKSSEAMMKLAGDIAQPLTARVTLVTDKVKSLAA